MLFWLGLLILIAYVLIAYEIIVGGRRIQFLRDIAPIAPAEAPQVSLIVAARNEERNIHEALQSLLNLDYPQLQIIVINDRSEDGTGAALDEMSSNEPRLEIVHLTELPAGWLGKNHALWQGSHRASGEILLFTDADVVMAPSALSRAVGYLQQESLDHLAATPEPRMPSLFLNMFAAAFGFFFGLFARPWKAPDPNSSCHIGIGAFNLVRAGAYHQVGGHEAIALRPDDDLKLGKIIKKGGFRQKLAYGTGLIYVEWYSSVRELVLGLEKNVFAGTDYRIGLAATSVLLQLVGIIWPYLALFVTEGSTLALYLGCVVVISLIVAEGARYHGFSPWYAVGFPFTAGFFAFIVIRSVTCNLAKGGITWRGTFYPLAELRKNRV